MAIPTTDLDIGTRYALQEDFNNGFVGRDRQVVIQTDDPKGYRPVIMDGVTQGGKSKVALLTDLSDYVAVSTYNSDKAGFETTTHASATYATKSELTSGLSSKADSSALASYATKTEVNSDLSAKAPIANPAFTGTATVGGKTIATTDQIPTDYLTESDLTEIEANITDLQDQISEKNPNYGTLGALPDNNVTQLSNLKVTNSTLANYVGVNAQLVYNTDTKQWVSMDGTTQGGSNILVNAKGDRGVIGGYSRSTVRAPNPPTDSAALYVGYSSADTQILDYKNVVPAVAESVTIALPVGDTVSSNPPEDISAVKVVYLNNASSVYTIDLNSIKRAGYTINYIGEAPEIRDDTNAYLFIFFFHGKACDFTFNKTTAPS